MLAGPSSPLLPFEQSLWGLPPLHPLHVGWPFPTAATLSAEPVGILVFLIQDT